MIDYYDKVQRMSEKKLSEEHARLVKMLTKTNPTSPVYQQLLNMHDTLEEAILERTLARNITDTTDEVIDIGEIQSDVHTPDYSSDELLNVVVQQYIDKHRRNT